MCENGVGTSIWGCVGRRRLGVDLGGGCGVWILVPGKWDGGDMRFQMRLV